MSVSRVIILAAMLTTVAGCGGEKDPEKPEADGKTAPVLSDPPEDASGDGDEKRGPSEPVSPVFRPPSDWSEEEGSSRTVHRFRLAARGSDEEDVLVEVSSPVDEVNVAKVVRRWKSDFRPEDGDADVGGSIENLDLTGLEVEVHAFEGRYVARVAPRNPRRHDKPGWGMRAAIVKSAEGVHLITMAGPRNTMSFWSRSFDSFLENLVP